MSRTALSPQAFVTLLLVACLFGANHVAARLALDDGVDVLTAVTARSLGTAAAVALLVAIAGVRARPSARQWRMLGAIALLVSLQSAGLYAAVARIPVALALLAFNTYPLWTAAWARLLYGERVEPRVMAVMPVIFVGLALALDGVSALRGAGATALVERMGIGVALAVGTAALFGLVLALTQHEVANLDGRFRTAVTMAGVGTLALVAALAGTGLHGPRSATGWIGLVGLTALYGTAITTAFTLLPRLGVVGNSPILNIEPVAALVLAWLILGQAIAPLQVVGALIVVGAVMALGLRRSRPAGPPQAPGGAPQRPRTGPGAPSR